MTNPTSVQIKDANGQFQIVSTIDALMAQSSSDSASLRSISSNTLTTAQTALAVASNTLTTAQTSLAVQSNTLSTAQSALAVASNTLTTAQSSLAVASNTLSTAQTALNVLVSAQSAIISTLSVASNTLSVTSNVLSTAQTALAVASNTHSTAQSILLVMSNTLTTAQTSLAVQSNTLSTAQSILTVQSNALLTAISAQSAVVSTLAVTSNVLTTAQTALAVSQSAQTATIGLFNVTSNAYSNGVPGVGYTAIVSNTITRTADTNAYLVGDIVAQSVTNTSCVAVPIPVARFNNFTGMLRRCRVKVNDTAWANAQIFVHVYQNQPTFTFGDNGTFSGGTTESGYIGAFDVTLDKTFSDAVKGVGAPRSGGEMNFAPASGTTAVYVVLETRTGLTPGSAKVFTITFEVLQN